MDEKNTGGRFYIFLFVIVLCMPWFFWIFLGKYADTANYENRELAVRPVFQTVTYDSFADEYEAYWNDNLPFKNMLVSLNSRVDYYLFHASASDRVIVGKEGWLFYADSNDGDPLACYQGRNLYSEEQLQATAENLLDIQQYLAKRGTEFVVFIAPNKERMYPEMMPDFYGEPADRYTALQVVNYIKEHTDIKVVYPYEAIMEAKKHLNHMIFYHKADTHWNNAGAYIGSKELLEELDIYLPKITGSDLNISEIENPVSDLAGMINMSADLQDKEYDYSISVKNGSGAEADSRSIFMLHDSFGQAMFSYLDISFGEGCFVHRRDYNVDDYIEQQPDIFVFEVVERYIGELSSFCIY